jgi:hypothetical protein
MARSDCIRHYQIHEKSNPTNARLEEIIERIKMNFETEKKWEKLMKDYWDKAKLFS